MGIRWKCRQARRISTSQPARPPDSPNLGLGRDEMRHYPPAHPASVCQSTQYQQARLEKRKLDIEKGTGRLGRHRYIPPHPLRCSLSPHLTLILQRILTRYRSHPQQVNLCFWWHSTKVLSDSACFRPRPSDFRRSPAGPAPLDCFGNYFTYVFQMAVCFFSFREGTVKTFLGVLQFTLHAFLILVSFCKLFHSRTHVGEEQVLLRDLNLQICTNLFGSGENDCQIIKSLQCPLVEIGHLRIARILPSTRCWTHEAHRFENLVASRLDCCGKCENEEDTQNTELCRHVDAYTRCEGAGSLSAVGGSQVLVNETRRNITNRFRL